MNKNQRLPCRALLALPATLMLLGAPGIAAAKAPTACNAAAEVKTQFDTLRREFAQDRLSVDEATYRSIASDYVSLAEQCYAATYGGSASSGMAIDEGGVWMPSSKPGLASADYVLFGTKWGAGSPFPGGTDIAGPRTPGGTVTYSFMPAGVSFAAEPSPPPDTNTPITGLATFDACMLEEIASALGAWSAVADITFVPVTDGGGAFDAEPVADIRIGAHTFDGAGGVLAHAFFPPPNGTFAAGDTHFDIAEPWACDPTLGAIDFAIVALHEFGHAIGLSHEPTQIAVMNPIYNPALKFGPLADDTIAAAEIYGTAGAAQTTFFPDVGIGTDTPTAPVDVNIGTWPPGIGNSVLRLERVGSVGFQLKNTSASFYWQFTNAAASGDFVISRSGTGKQEFKLNAAGDLTLTGDIFTTTCTSPTPCAPDYVFAPDYELMPIEDLEDFIRRERHLPNVPSAEELVGPISVNQMQMRLLEKVEELTLYTIEQQRTIRELERRLDAVER